MNALQKVIEFAKNTMANDEIAEEAEKELQHILSQLPRPVVLSPTGYARISQEEAESYIRAASLELGPSCEDEWAEKCAKVLRDAGKKPS